MRVLLIISALRGGGAEKAMINIASGLARRGHEVHLSLLGNQIEHEVPSNVKLHALLKPGERFHTGWLGERASARKLARLYQALGGHSTFDLVVSTLPFTDAVVRSAGIHDAHYRIANTLSAEVESLRKRSWIKAFRRGARYRQLYAGQKLIAVSNGVAEDLRDKLRVRFNDLVTIYNPFDFDAIRREAALDDPDIPRSEYILHAGSFLTAKRHDLLLDAFAKAKLPHTLVLLTQAAPRLSEMIAARGLQSRVMVAGFRNNPYPWFARASAVVLCSDREGMPNVLIEALICGAPAVSTDCPSGPREILTGEMRRFLVPCGDANALAARMKEVVEMRPAIDPAALRPFDKDSSLDAYEALARRR